MTPKERMLCGKLYISADNEIATDNKRAKRLTRIFNQTTEDDWAYRRELIKELFRKTGETVNIEPPFLCDYGCQISVGENFYANYGCVILDACEVNIGSNVMFGPRVCVFTAAHPIDADIRNTLLEFGKPVNIGDGCWIGGNATILPGVNIGNNAVIGAGSVVTRDIPDNVVAAGNPCRVLRAITETDKKFWEAQKASYYADMEGRGI